MYLAISTAPPYLNDEPTATAAHKGADRRATVGGQAAHGAWLTVSKFSSQPLCATVCGRHEPAGDDGVDRRGIDAIANAHAIFHHHRAEAEVVQMLVAHVRC